VNDGRANRRDKPTVGDRPRAPSPTQLPTASHAHDVPVYHRRDSDEDVATGDVDNDDDDDWDEIRSFCFSLSAVVYLLPFGDRILSVEQFA